MIANKLPESEKILKQWLIENKKQPCPRCGSLIGNINGSKEAFCSNCGYKDPCCD